MAAKSRDKPELLALLICERALFDEDNIVSLIGIVDTFNFRIVVHGSTGVPILPTAVLSCVVFTRWGVGKGEFVEELALVLPNGQEDGPRVVSKFTKPSGFQFHQIRHRARFAIAEQGVYKWRIYLNGEFIREHPFKVNLAVDEDTEAASPGTIEQP